MEAKVQWTTPSPFWKALADDSSAAVRKAFQQPAILRFAKDTFMQDFMSMLELKPSAVPDLWAQPETWRNPTGEPEVVEPIAPFTLPMYRRRLLPLPFGAAPRVARAPVAKAPLTLAARTEAKTADPDMPLKLYQPAHQRFYLVSACLVCRIPGMPDRTVNTSDQEKVSFVVRRLKPAKPGDDCSTGGCDEYAFVNTGKGFRWEPVTEGDSLITGEEQNPLFNVGFDEAGRRRRLLAGLIPVGKRETYMGASMTLPRSDPDYKEPIDPRQALLRSQVLDPWQMLIDQAQDVKARLEEAPVLTPPDGNVVPDNQKKLRKQLREQIQLGSWYVLLEFADFLQKYLPEVWTSLKTGSAAPTTEQNAVLTALAKIKFVDVNNPSQAVALTWALTAIVAFARDLEQIDKPFSLDEYNAGGTKWPTFVFRFADPDPAAFRIDGIDKSEELIDVIMKAVLARDPVGPPLALPLAAQPLPDARDPGWFVIRCVFERPNCGPHNPTIVSAPTEVFQMAMFFDPDAPSRPIRIALPVDISPAGLRKFSKNTAFMISDALCGKINKLGKLTLGDLVMSVLPWPFHKDLPSDPGGPCSDGPGLEFGMICSLSIPIVTICALIILMIIVGLLDFIFRWMPYFILCFPLPKFKAKKE